jgi:hypothetical protein
VFSLLRVTGLSPATLGPPPDRLNVRRSETRPGSAPCLRGEQVEEAARQRGAEMSSCWICSVPSKRSWIQNRRLPTSVDVPEQGLFSGAILLDTPPSAQLWIKVGMGHAQSKPSPKFGKVVERPLWPVETPILPVELGKHTPVVPDTYRQSFDLVQPFLRPTAAHHSGRPELDRPPSTRTWMGSFRPRWR